MIGSIRRRVLINTFVDPSQAAALLPSPLRPHVVAGGTVVGCCILELEAVRPVGVPAVLGRSLPAIAHRVSAEWDTDDGVEVGVFVPIRLTSSRLAVMASGRIAPGVHRHTAFEVDATPTGRSYRIGTPGDPMAISVGVSTGGSATAELASGDPAAMAGATCLAARIGCSPDRRGRLEAIRMDLDPYVVQPIDLRSIDSTFLRSFTTAEPISAVMIEDVGVRWTTVGPSMMPR